MQDQEPWISGFQPLLGLCKVRFTLLRVAADAGITAIPQPPTVKTHCSAKTRGSLSF